MKKIVLVVAAFTCLVTSVNAQKKEKPYKEIFYKEQWSFG